jgi:parafibromin
MFIELKWHAAESTTPPGSPRRSGATVALPSTPGTNLAEPAGISPSKRRYLADTQDVEVVKKIKQNEVELRDRNTVLRGTKANVS